jgi:glycerate kinase
VPAALVAGQVAARPPAGVPVLSLAGLAGGVPAALADPARYLRLAGQRLAAGWGAGDSTH